jgi:diadenosine tetraphosphatase ApaH/serine/threonine PP2A family protein phosphatase
MENKRSEVIQLAERPESSVKCLVFLEQRAKLVIKDGIKSESVQQNGKDMFTIRAPALTVTRIHSNPNLNSLKNIESGEWIILLGSCDEEHELFVKNDSLYTLNAGKGPIYLIDCKSGQHFSSNDWSVNQQKDDICFGQYSDHNIDSEDNNWVIVPIENRVKEVFLTQNFRGLDIIEDLLMERVLDNSYLLTTSTFDPKEVLERLRQYSKEFFAETDKTKKATLSQRLNEYLPPFVLKLCQKLNADVLDKESRVVLVRSPSFVFGDIHGNLQDLYEYENEFWASNKASVKDYNYVFLGDFVDRGSHSVEVSVYLFLLKLSQPDKFMLIRGNHEVRSVNKTYSFYSECNKKYGHQVGGQVWDQINQSFERLPIAAVIDEGVFCCHGGVPKALTKLEDLMKIPKPLVQPDVESPAAHELMWNDPIESMTSYNKNMVQVLRDRNVEFIANRARSTGFYYTELAVDRFFNCNDLTYLIRAHESVKEGFKIHFNGKVVTVFSSSHYCGINNSTACIKINSDLIQPMILKKGQR